MAWPEHLFVFSYDIQKDSARRKAAELLEEWADRVQMSVFEGRMSLNDARRLAGQVERFLGEADSLRVYCIGAASLESCMVRGAGLLPEADDFILA